MDFSEAADELLSIITCEALSSSLGVFRKDLWRMRLPDGDPNRVKDRPENWQAIMKEYALNRARHFAELAEKL
jgi:hypothetical protein